MTGPCESDSLWVCVRAVLLKIACFHAEIDMVGHDCGFVEPFECYRTFTPRGWLSFQPHEQRANKLHVAAHELSISLTSFDRLWRSVTIPVLH